MLATALPVRPTLYTYAVPTLQGGVCGGQYELPVRFTPCTHAAPHRRVGVCVVGGSEDEGQQLPTLNEEDSGEVERFM